MRSILYYVLILGIKQLNFNLRQQFLTYYYGMLVRFICQWVLDFYGFFFLKSFIYMSLIYVIVRIFPTRKIRMLLKIYSILKSFLLLWALYDLCNYGVFYFFFYNFMNFYEIS